MPSARPLAFVAAGLVLVAPARAQPGAVAPAAVDPAQIRTLDRALDLVAWDAARHGALLAVDAANTRPWQPRPQPGVPSPPLAPLPPPRFDGYALRTVAGYFGRKTFRLGTITALAPPEMTVLNANPGKGDPMAGLRRDEKLRLLQASLSQAQWARLGSPNGLGAGDLAADQSALFLSILPDPFRVRKITLGPGGGHIYRPDAESAMTLSPSQRASVRLRLTRSLAWSFMSANSPNSTHGFGRTDPRPEGTEILTIVDTFEYYPRSDAYGVRLKAELPNRLKPGHLNFNAPVFDAPVSLATPVSLGEMIKRIGQATGIELYADPRVGELSLWTRGTTARAGDVLKALCLAVTGAFRRVGPEGEASAPFVLTHDVVGLGARRALLGEWAADLQARKRQIEESIQKRIAAQKPAQHIRFTDDDPLAPSPEMQRRVEEDISRRDQSPRRFDGPGTMAVTDLPPAAQAIIKEQLARHRTSEPLRTDRVVLNLRMRLSYLVPGLGEVDSPHLGLDFNSLLPPPQPSAPPTPEGATGPVTLTPDVATRALHITPQTVEEVAQVAQEARRRGLNHLWVEVPEADGKALLAAAVQAGKENNLTVVAVVRLLRVPAAGQNDAMARNLDVNVLGESAGRHAARRLSSPALYPWVRHALLRSGDWLRVDTPAAAVQRKRHLREIAATPGLAGLALCDTAAPGYALPADAGNIYGTGGTELGYTPEMRLAFLRQKGADPIDIGSNPHVGGNVATRLPFFDPDNVSRVTFVDGRAVAPPGGQTLPQKWNGFRYDANARFLAELYKTLRAEHPDLPLLLQDRPQHFSALPGWYGSWDKPGGLPRTYFAGNQQQTLVQRARVSSRYVVRSIVYYGLPLGVAPPGPQPTPAEAYARSIRYFLEKEKRGWDGIVLDLSDRAVPEALPLLEALATVSP